MKKMIFLLLMAVVLVCFMPAMNIVAHPPGVMTLEAVMSSYGVAEGCSVTLGTASVQHDACICCTGFTALSNGTDSYAVRATENDIKPINTGQPVDYHIRL